MLSLSSLAVALLPLAGFPLRQRAAVHLITASELKVTKYAPIAVTPRATTFEGRLTQLQALSEVHGHALPSAENNADESLVRWAARQRALYRQGTLADDIVDDLDGVGFVWDPLAHAWEARLEELEQFYAANGHSNVPSGGTLARWTSRQRTLHRQGQLRPERRAALLELSFEFDPMTARWERRLAEYAAVSASGGSGMPEPLVKWASRQRVSRAAGKLAPERVEALNQLPGWRWSAARASGPSALRRLGRRLANEVGAGARALEVSEVSGSGRRLCYAPSESAGRALCISVGARRESGAAEEVEDAREALRQLGYEVIVVQNPTASELAASFHAFTRPECWTGHASSVVALMGHGSGATLECQDGKVTSLRYLFGLLAAAPALVGKPKICLVQACRRGEQPMISSMRTIANGAVSASAARVDEIAAIGGEARETDAAEDAVDDTLGQLTEEHDFLFAYATTAGKVAYRGALFGAFREVVGEVGSATSWIELLHLTNERLCAWSRGREQPLPSMEISSTLRGGAFAPADLVTSDDAADALVGGAGAAGLARPADRAV